MPPDPILGQDALGAAIVATALSRPKQCLELSLAKHRSLASHPRIERRVAARTPSYEYGEASHFRADDAPDPVAAARRAGFERLHALYPERFARTAALTAEVQDGVSVPQFAGTHHESQAPTNSCRTSLPLHSQLRAA